MTERHALACFLRGLALSLSKPYLIVSLWLIQLLLSAVLILPISNFLHDDLDNAVAGSRMVANPESGWWDTVQREHPDLFGNFGDLTAGLLTPEGVKSTQLAGLRGIGATAVSLGFLAVVLHAFALGGVFGTLREPKASLLTFGREGMRRFPAFLVFTLASLAAAEQPVDLSKRAALRGRVTNSTAKARFPPSRPCRCSRCSPHAAHQARRRLGARLGRARTCPSPASSPDRQRARPAGALRRSLAYVVMTSALYLIWLWLDPSADPDSRWPLILTQQVCLSSPSFRQGGLLRRRLRGAHARAVAGILLRSGARPGVGGPSARRNGGCGRRSCRSPGRRHLTAPGRGRAACEDRSSGRFARGPRTREETAGPPR